VPRNKVVWYTNYKKGKTPAAEIEKQAAGARKQDPMQTVTSKQAGVSKKEIDKKAALGKKSGVLEPTFGLAYGKTYFDRHSHSDDSMGRVSHKVGGRLDLLYIFPQ
jgi:hypothetical protein